MGIASSQVQMIKGFKSKVNTPSRQTQPAERKQLFYQGFLSFQHRGKSVDNHYAIICNFSFRCFNPQLMRGRRLKSNQNKSLLESLSSLKEGQCCFQLVLTLKLKKPLKIDLITSSEASCCGTHTQLLSTYYLEGRLFMQLNVK